MQLSRMQPRSAAGARAPAPAARRAFVARTGSFKPASLQRVSAASSDDSFAWAKPAIDFLAATDFKITETDLYKNTLKQYWENKYVQQSIGWTPLAESINGRSAMIGFLAGASAEILGAGPALLQLSKSPQPVLAVLALITVGSIVPVVKGTEGGYLKSLRETYTIPEDTFTEVNERVIGRLAMIGTGGLVLLELLKGSAVL
ncbi:hypothetical protein HT031_004936 [Scenedesmus sp. PABB004]|nr:hypothetical protein HT031_004936 [Scenedesmus sp. PABB004]